MNTQSDSVLRAAKCVGSQATLARLIDVTPPTVNQWVKGIRRVPAELCPVIERATEGAVRCEDLRPDVAWDVLRMQSGAEPVTQQGA